MVFIEGRLACGKTEFLLSEFSAILKAGAEPSRILVFCSGNVRELFLSRVNAAAVAGFRELHIDTFSGFAKWVTRKNYFLFDILPDFMIAAGREEELIIREVLSRPVLGKHLRKYKNCVSDRGFVKEVMDFIDNFKICPHTVEQDKELFLILNAYNDDLREKNLLDLRDVENFCLEAVKSGALDGKFDYIFLDGWEDLNAREVEIFRVLLKTAKNAFAAGDESAGIYEFLGADAAGNKKVFEEEFSSRKEILVKKSSPGVSGSGFTNLFDEARWILGKIKEFLNAGVPADEMAVVVRSIGDEAKMIEDMAAMSGVPVSCSTGSPFFKHPQFISFLSFLFWLGDFEDAFELRDVLRLPVFGFGPLLISEIAGGARAPKIDEIKKQGRRLANDGKRNITARIFQLYRFCGLEKTVSGVLVLSRLFGCFFDYLEKIEDEVCVDDFEVFAAFLKDAVGSFSRASYLGDIKGAVKILTVHEAKGAHFRYSFIPGVMWGNFPREFRPDSYIETGRSEEKHYAVEKRIFDIAVNTASEKAFLSFRTDSEDAEIPTPYLEEYLEAGVSAPPAAVADIFEGKVKMTEVKLGRPRVSAPLAESVSATALENYIACPLKYFIEKVIRVKREPTPASSCGRVVHKIMEKFHGVFPKAEAADAMKKKMGELIDAVFEEALKKEEFPDVYTFKCWKSFFTPFLLKYAETERLFDVRLLEHKVEISGFGVKITGRIDRVDSAGGGFEIIDYKTSPSSKFKASGLVNRIADGRHIALPLYSTAVEGCGKFTLFWLADYDKENDYPMKISLDLASPPVSESINRMKDVVRENIADLRSGNFSPRVNNRLCFSCGYKNICRLLENAE
ncbi:MAG: PD-(D/E)XK nuclease family protein [bacterium]